MKQLLERGELERTKRMIAAAYVVWELKQGIRGPAAAPGRKAGFAPMRFGAAAK